MSSKTERRERRAGAALIAAVVGVIAIGVVRGRDSGAPPLAPGAGGMAVADAVGGGVVRRPQDDGEPLARVPARARDRAAAERERLRRALRAAPGDLTAASRLARSLIGAARASGDPRFLGRAEAALAPWWDRADAPAEALFLRATIRQSRHEFDAALADLDRLVTVAPDDPEGHLERAVVLAVRGRYAEALASCARAGALASPFVGAACRAPILGVTGGARAAAAALAAALPAAPSAPEVAWGRSLLGDLRLWAGDERGAEAELRAALAVAPDDAYARAALADLLLDGGRADEAAALVDGRDDNDGLLLRRALARAAGGAGGGDAAVAAMAARLGAARLRGDSVHQREEARFALAVERDPARALRLAAANWQVQREPADARVLLEAALAAGAPAAGAPALAWLDETGCEWPRLRALAVALRGGRT